MGLLGGVCHAGSAGKSVIKLALLVCDALGQTATVVVMTKKDSQHFDDMRLSTHVHRAHHQQHEGACCPNEYPYRAPTSFCPMLVQQKHQ
ncbi:hypothetical protein CEP53_000082 [Fusarium sp. AF-6]|nr:hypothetical protein CEP53_000082 [Fusarium sp. AF-6]